jgi:hypothetical protein
MGFYYLLLFVIGVALLITGAVKKIISLIVIGILFIVISLLLLFPGSSDFIFNLMK